MSVCSLAQALPDSPGCPCRAGAIQGIKFGPHKKECYVVLGSVEEAERVRDATFGIQWPPDNKDSSLRPKWAPAAHLPVTRRCCMWGMVHGAWGGLEALLPRRAITSAMAQLAASRSTPRLVDGTHKTSVSLSSPAGWSCCRPPCCTSKSRLCYSDGATPAVSLKQ